LSNVTRMVALKDVASSNISAIGYAPAEEGGLGILTVRFSTGATYEYDDVPTEVGEEIFNAESIGRFFFQKVRNYYSSRRIDQAGVNAEEDYPR